MLIFFLMPFSLAFLTEFLPLPSFIRYSMDAILIAFGGLFLMRRYLMIPQKVKHMARLAIIFFLYVGVTYFFNYQSVFYLIWGVRNTFRYYLAFFVFAVYLNQDDAFDFLKILDLLFWVNFALAVYQFFILGVEGDYLGGIFGIQAGTNGYTLMFLCIIIGKSLIKTFSGEEGYNLCILKCGATMLIAAMAEMKFYFIVFILILILAAVMTKFSKQKLVFIFAAIGVVSVMASLLTFWHAEFKDFLSLEKIWKTATQENYATKNDLNRLSAISTLMDKYILDPVQHVFGMGLGNCDTSNVGIFNSHFYQNYSFLHYNWFTFVMVFLETGFIGLGLHLSFFVICMVFAIKQMKSNYSNKLFCRLSILMSVLCVVLTFYNASLRTEAGYMAYFILSLPFLADTVNEKLINKG